MPKPAGGPPTGEELEDASPVVKGPGDPPWTHVAERMAAARLVAQRALKLTDRYAKHDQSCPRFMLYAKKPCTCGLDLVLAAWTRFAEGGGDAD
jgi:hypothetical protein